MVEFHSLWQLLPAIRIARALAPFDTKWHEDPIKMDSLASLKRYAEASPAPICASETLASRWAFRDLLETGAAGVVMLDLSWCGGLSEAQQDRGDGRGLASAGRAARLHRAGGALRLDASVAQRAERADPGKRARLLSHLVPGPCRPRCPKVENGFITVPPGPGLGMELAPDLDEEVQPSTTQVTTIEEL